MKILKDYAEAYNFNYDDLLTDFMNSTPEEQDEFIMQIGGQVASQEQGPSLEEIIMAYAQVTGEDPNVIMEQLQQIPQDQRQQVLMEMVNVIQQSQQEPQQQIAQTGIPVTEYGYYELDPIEDPYAYIPTEDGRITMQGIDYPINAYDGYSGEYLDTMLPGEEYLFDTDLVLEEPVKHQALGKVTKKVIKGYDDLAYGSGKVALAAAPYTATNKRHYTQTEDALWEDVLEILDPTGITSWDDVYRRGKDFRKDPNWGTLFDLGIESLGAVPVIGTAGKLAKGIKLSNNLIKSAKTTKAGQKALNGINKLKGTSSLLDVFGDGISLGAIFYDNFQTGGDNYFQPGGGSPPLSTADKEIVNKFFKEILQPELNHFLSLDKAKLQKNPDLHKRFNQLNGFLQDLDNAVKLNLRNPIVDRVIEYANNAKPDKKGNLPHFQYSRSEATKSPIPHRFSASNAAAAAGPTPIPGKNKLSKTLNFVKRSLPYVGGLGLAGYGLLEEQREEELLRQIEDRKPPKNAVTGNGVNLTLDPTRTTQEGYPLYTDKDKNIWVMEEPGFFRQISPRKTGDTSKNDSTEVIKAPPRDSTQTKGVALPDSSRVTNVPVAKIDSTSNSTPIVTDSTGNVVKPTTTTTTSPAGRTTTTTTKKPATPAVAKKPKGVNPNTNKSSGTVPTPGEVVAPIEKGGLRGMELEVLTPRGIENISMPISNRIQELPEIPTREFRKTSGNNTIPPIKLGLWNRSPELINNLLGVSRFAAATAPTAPIFRGSARYNFRPQPLMEFEPIGNAIQSQFNAIANNINPNSTTGMSVLSNLQGQALEKTIQAANQIAVQNAEIQNNNIRGALQAYDLQFNQQQQMDAAAYDQYLRRAAARQLSIDGATNDLIAMNNNAMTRKMYLDMLPVSNPGIVDISTPLDRLAGRRVFGQNPNLELSYGNQTTTATNNPRDLSYDKTLAQIEKILAEAKEAAAKAELNTARTYQTNRR